MQETRDTKKRHQMPIPPGNRGLVQISGGSLSVSPRIRLIAARRRLPAAILPETRPVHEFPQIVAGPFESLDGSDCASYCRLFQDSGQDTTAKPDIACHLHFVSRHEVRHVFELIYSRGEELILFVGSLQHHAIFLAQADEIPFKLGDSLTAFREHAPDRCERPAGVG